VARKLDEYMSMQDVEAPPAEDALDVCFSFSKPEFESKKQCKL